MLTQRPVNFRQWMRATETALRRLDARVARLGATTAATSASGGILIPSYTTAERQTIFAEVPMIVYDSGLGKVVLYDGVAWVNVDGTAL